MNFRNLRLSFLVSFFVSLFMIIALSPILLFITILIRLNSGSPVFYWSNRVGMNGEIFRMPKFRTMLLDTPELATHLLNNSDSYLSPFGGFLRRTSLDELPQLFSVLKGDMAIVGPRPALFNQKDLIVLRKTMGVDKVLPGVTGWAQVNGRDELTIIDKVNLDVEYIKKKSFYFDLKIIWMTIINVTKQDGILS